MNEDFKAICLDRFITARETNSRQILLSCPSDITEQGVFIPTQEIYLSREQIAQLHRWANPDEEV